MDMKKKKEAKGTVLITPELCKGCAFCIEFCPTHVLQFSAEYNSKGYHYPILADPSNCSGCDLCGLYCPDFAIYGVRYKDLEKQKDAGAVAGQLKETP